MKSDGATCLPLSAAWHDVDLPAGIVVGEAARVGNHVTIMQHVTLGGTGNEPGDRHPKIGNHVQIGVKATILGGDEHLTPPPEPPPESCQAAGPTPKVAGEQGSSLMRKRFDVLALASWHSVNSGWTGT